jgi:MFS family permease
MAVTVDTSRYLSTLAIILAVAAQWMGLLFTPATTASLADGLHFSVSQTATLHTMRLLSMFFSLPFFAFLCYYVHRGHLLGSTMVISSVITMCNASATNYSDFMLVNILSGLTMGAVHPVARSIIPNLYPMEKRGQFYGLIELASGIGGFIGVGVAVIFDQKHSTVAQDWQLVYVSIGLLQFGLGVGCLLLLGDPIRDGTCPPELVGDLNPPCREEIDELMSKRTFTTMVLQGMLGAFPWSAFSLLIPWFERLGMSKNLAVGIFAAIALGAALGGWIGGMIGDAASRCCKNGRVLVSHFSVLSGVVFAPCLLLAIPYHPDYAPAYIITGGLMGLFISWPAANQAVIQSDVLPPSMHPTSFAIQFWAEGAFSAFGPMFVGLLNDDVFNCSQLMPPGGTDEWESFPPMRKQELLNGMARAIVMVCCLFWGLCQLGYFYMYRTYPRESLTIA